MSIVLTFKPILRNLEKQVISLNYRIIGPYFYFHQELFVVFNIHYSAKYLSIEYLDPSSASDKSNVRLNSTL
jgi:hypothetical protein